MTPPRLPRRSAAVGGAAALALATLGVAGPAAADTHTAADARDVDDACVLPAESTFTDIAHLPEPTQRAITCLVPYDVAAGYTATEYRAAQGVRRYQVALFLYRQLAHLADSNDGIDLPEPQETTFTDVGELSAEAREAIGALAGAQIARGKSADRFAPDEVVTRLDMAALVNRAQDYVADQLDDAAAAYDPDAADVEYADLTEDIAAERRGHVYALTGAGVVEGTGEDTYTPYGDVTRAQMALFLARHLDENIENGRSLAVQESVVWNTSTVTAYPDLSDAVAAAGADERLVAMGEFTEAERMVLDDDGVVLTGRGEPTVHGSFEIRGADDVTLVGLVVQDYVDAAGARAGVYLADATGTRLVENVFVGGDAEEYAGRGVVNETGGATESALLAANEFYYHVTGVFANPSAEFDLAGNVFQRNRVGSGNDAPSVLRGNIVDGNAEGIGMSVPGSQVTDNYFGLNDVHVADYFGEADLAGLVEANGFINSVHVVESADVTTVVDTEE